MRSIGVVLVVAIATALHAVGWYLAQESVAPPNVIGQLASVSFSPINPDSNGEVDRTTAAQIKSDLAVIAPHTRVIRTIPPPTAWSSCRSLLPNSGCK